MRNSVWELLDKYPPSLVRLMARRKVGVKQVVAMTDQEIAIRTELPVERIEQIYWEPNWDNISFGEVREFIRACNFDPTLAADRNRANAYIHQKGGPKYLYLKESPLWSSLFFPLICHLKSSVN